MRVFRSLIVPVTKVIDAVNSHSVDHHLGILAGRHLPLGGQLRDHQLFDAADTPHPEGERLYRAVVETIKSSPT